ncbi:MAG: NAD(P)/FAD-dependent oxidoreductase [Pseudobutyrivibrio sp.]|nr:NAD(P)/FAD-dependent oxidoreductase [Pseudobutyrivibrio sp.]
MGNFDYDVLYIGSGHAAWHGAMILAQAGKKIAFAERDLTGGTCTNYGCDAKALLDGPAELVSALERYKDLGVTADIKMDWPKFMAYKHQSIDPLANVMTGMLTNAGFTIIRGSAKFVDSHTVQVADQCVTAENIVICTGQYDFKLPIPGNEYMHTSREILDLPQLPGHITFIGAGIISMEFASLLTQFGVKATVIEFADRALLQYSEEYSNRVVEKLKSVGVDFHFGESLSEIEKKGDKYYAKTASGLCVETDYILAATGRRANVDDLDLEKAGVEYSPRGIKVDDHMRTTTANIYASGDVVDKMIPRLTPTATFESNYIALAILGAPQPIQYPAVPNVVFTLPRIAAVGVTVNEALKNPDKYTVSKINYGQLLAFEYRNETDAEATVILDKDKYLVGAELYGDLAGEMINILAVVINGRMTMEMMMGTIWAFPTQTDGLTEMLAPMLHSDMPKM